MVPVRATAVAGDRQDRDVPVRGVQRAGHVIGHRTVRVAGYRCAEWLLHDLRLGPRALARERLCRPGFLPRVLRYRTLVDAERRGARLAIEDVVHAALAA